MGWRREQAEHDSTAQNLSDTAGAVALAQKELRGVEIQVMAVSRQAREERDKVYQLGQAKRRLEGVVASSKASLLAVVADIGRTEAMMERAVKELSSSSSSGAPDVETVVLAKLHARRKSLARSVAASAAGSPRAADSSARRALAPLIVDGEGGEDQVAADYGADGGQDGT